VVVKKPVLISTDCFVEIADSCGIMNGEKKWEDYVGAFVHRMKAMKHLEEKTTIPAEKDARTEKFLETSKTRCPCCKVVLRTKPRTGRRVHLDAL